MPGSCAHVCPRTVGIANPSGAASESAADAGRPERAPDRRRIGPASGADWPGARRGNGICRADPSSGRAATPLDGTAVASDDGDRRVRGTTAAAARGRDGAADVPPGSERRAPETARRSGRRREGPPAPAPARVTWRRQGPGRAPRHVAAGARGGRGRCS